MCDWKREAESIASQELLGGFSPKESVFAGSPTPPDEQESLKRQAWEHLVQEAFDAAAVEFRRWLAQHPTDHVAWSTLAWCEYKLFHYKDALTAITKALEIRPNNLQSLSIKGCILAENGIANRDRASLLRAREIFAKVSSGATNWTDHFNFANALAALGEHDAARQEYLEAIRLAPNEPCVWKNLGSIYNHLKNYDEELKCYDKALSLDPNHVEALVSKGVTLITALGRLRDGTAMLEQALSKDGTFEARCPDVRYWLAEAYYQLGELQISIQNATRGLDLAPGHNGLLRLKAQVLSELWRQDQSFRAEAISFFRFRLGLSARDLESLVELGELYLSSGLEESVWELLDSHFEKELGKPSEHLKRLGLSPRQCIGSFRYFPAYESFRKHSPVDEYIALLRASPITIDEALEKALTTAAAVSFGLGCDLLAGTEPAARDLALLKRLRGTVGDLLMAVLPRVSLLLTAGIKESPPEQVAEKVSALVANIGTIGLLELSREVGFIVGIFAVDTGLVDKLTSTDSDAGKWYIDVVKRTLYEVSEQLQLFRK